MFFAAPIVQAFLKLTSAIYLHEDSISQWHAAMQHWLIVAGHVKIVHRPACSAIYPQILHQIRMGNHGIYHAFLPSQILNEP